MSSASRAFRLGLFVFTALLILAAGVFWVGSKRFLFTSTYTLYADFDNVAGLSDGAEVHVGGFTQGIVKHIDLPHRPDQKMRVIMNLKGPTRDVIKKDSVAAIRSEGMIGDKFIEISFGSNSAPKVTDGDTIRGEAAVQISDLVKKADGLLDSAKDTMDSVQDTAENLNSITAKINRGSGTIGALINNQSTYRNVNQAATALQEDAEALKHNFLLRGFFKKRGYQDSAELTKHAISQLPAQQYTNRFVFDAGKIFDKPDSAKLENEKALNKAGDFLEHHSFGLAVVSAYTDMKGDSDKDRVLSEARAMVVREYLVENFKFDDSRLKTIGLGKSPDVQQGGRVEILVYPPGNPGRAARNQASKER